MAKLESLSGGSGVHVFLVLWKAARAVEAYAEKSITEHAADMEKLAAASLTKAERKTLISLLKKIGYKAVGYAQHEEDAA